MTLLIVIAMVSAIIIAVKVQQAKNSEKVVNPPTQDIVYPIQENPTNGQITDDSNLDDKPDHGVKNPETDIQPIKSGKKTKAIDNLVVEVETKKTSAKKKEVKNVKTSDKTSTNKTKKPKK